MGHRVPRPLPQHSGDCRDHPPAQHLQTLLASNSLDALAGRLALLREPGQEYRTGGIPTGRRQRELAHAPEELIRDLSEDAGPITCSRIRPDSTAMLQVPQSIERLDDDIVSRRSAKGGDYCQTTGVSIERGVDETP